MNWTPSKIAGMLTDKAKLGSLCQHLFKDDFGKPLKLYTYQLDIVHAIVSKQVKTEDNTYKKVLCWATTRAGKSMAVAIGVILLACFSQGERIRIVGPTRNKTRIVMGYVQQHILDHPILIDRLLLETNLKIERIKKELSKEKLTFKDNNDVMIVSADIKKHGESLVGEGGSVVIVDEIELITVEIVRTGIMRMLGDTPNYFLFLISNPVRMGYMYDSRRDSSYYQIKIGWEQCVREGRLSYDFIMEQKQNLTPTEFTIWYESEYPEEGEDTLNKWNWIMQARDEHKKIPPLKDEEIPDGRFRLGVDVARFGVDWTVFTTLEMMQDGRRMVRDITKTSKKDTMVTVGDILTLDRKYKYELINVDEAGLGGGVIDRLKEKSIGSKVAGVQAGQLPQTESAKKRFKNIKAEMHFNVSKMLEEATLLIPDDKKLIDQLAKFRHEQGSDEKNRIIDADGPSPDEADSLALACLKTLQVAFSPTGRSGDDQTSLVGGGVKKGSIMKF